MANLDEVREAKEQKKEELLARPNVVGVGAGFKQTGGEVTDQVVLVAMVREKLPLSALAPEDVVPQHVNGVATDVIEVGELRAFQTRTERWRPAPGGISLGHYRITAGTLGCLVFDRTNGEALILSNNHVLANSNNAQPEDPILQPGPADGGRLPEDRLAVLVRFIPLHYEEQPEEKSCLPVKLVLDALRAFGLQGVADRWAPAAVPQVNLVDAAVARPMEGACLANILEIGTPAATTPVALGMAVRKSGRTTALTTGQVQIIDTTVRVNYGEMQTARFEHQFITSPMSSGGDSGSLLVTGDPPLAVGLLFGGSEAVTIFNPIDLVLDALGVRL